MGRGAGSGDLTNVIKKLGSAKEHLARVDGTSHKRNERIHHVYSDNMAIRLCHLTREWMGALSKFAVVCDIDNGAEALSREDIAADQRYKDVASACKTSRFLDSVITALDMDNGYMYHFHRLLVRCLDQYLSMNKSRVFACTLRQS